MGHSTKYASQPLANPSKRLEQCSQIVPIQNPGFFVQIDILVGIDMVFYFGFSPNTAVSVHVVKSTGMHGGNTVEVYFKIMNYKL